MKYSFLTPEEVSTKLAARLKAFRLSKKWKRSTLSNRSGVTIASLKRFEQTGKVSMDNFLKLIHALGRLDEMNTLLKTSTVKSLDDLRKQNMQKPKRGSL
ncbi:MAG: helix-turn-helix transcriptional regulator [Desulfobacteraceae bacterium]|nr:helix-turn-helix transcriptional regulator [Desulfobacteraceae bacterium]